MLAGALDARCNGRPMHLRAAGDRITASMALRHAWALRPLLRSRGPLHQLLARNGLRLGVRVLGLRLPVHPGNVRGRER